MGTYETICRLCLKICESSKSIKGNMKDVLNTLLPKIDLTVTQEPVVCSICADMLIKCFDFKSTYLFTHDYNVSSVNKNNVKLDLKDDYRSRVEYSAGVIESHDICRFCIRSVKNCSAISPKVEKGDVLMEKMMRQCFPELDLRIIEKPVICAPCHRSLEDFFHFAINCSTVEGKIKEYCETLDLNSRGQEELSRLLRFTINEVDDSIGIVKVEKQLCEESEIGKGGDIVNRIDVNEIVKEEVEFKIESFMDIDDTKFNNEEQFIPEDTLTDKEESNNLDVIKVEETFCGDNELKRENPVEMEDHIFLLNEEIEIETDEPDFIRLEDGDILPQLEVASKLHIEQKCIVPNFEADALKSYTEQTLPNDNVSTGILYQCAFCSFQTKYNQCLKNHVLKRCQAKIKVTMYKCDSCSYQTENKNRLKQHQILHKSPSEVVMYSCESCAFQTKYKSGIKRHLLTHNGPSEVTMYKCDSCSYQTNKKQYLNSHSLIHKDRSEVTMYNCDFCLYQTNNKYKFNRHLLTHKDPSEVTMYKCASCLYQTKYKGCLKVHLQLHTGPSEVAVYQCDSCSYQTNKKQNLNSHSLKHKDRSEVTMYKCDSCSFQTKRKSSLNSHLLTHMDPLKVTMYKCDSCSYQTKQKSNLELHLLNHKDPSKVTLFKCDFCSFQSKYKHYIKKHLIIHKKPSEVTMYKCDICLYQAKRKSNLKEHLQTHKDPSEMTMYKCNSCVFQSNHKSVLKRHLITHKNRPELQK